MKNKIMPSKHTGQKDNNIHYINQRVQSIIEKENIVLPKRGLQHMSNIALIELIMRVEIEFNIVLSEISSINHMEDIVIAIQKELNKENAH